MKNKILFALILVLSSCYEDQNLGGGYYYLPPYEAYDIGYPANSILYRSSQKNSFEDIIAQNDVELIHFDNDWIAFLKTDSTKSYGKRISAYIINKNTDSIRGPYNKSKYNQTAFNDLGLDSSFKWR